MLHRRRTVGSSPSDKKNATLPVVEEVELLKADEQALVAKETDASADSGKDEKPRTPSPNTISNNTSIILESAIIGDYDLKKSPSTQALLLQYLERSNLSNLELLRRRSQYSLQLRHQKFAPEFFRSTLKLYKNGMNNILDDDFWKCFEEKKPRPWNWNAYLFPLWVVGVFIRYFILFPLRLLVFVIGWILVAIGMTIFQGFFPRDSPLRKRMELNIISMMCGVFCFTWGAVIHYHGSPAEPKPGEPNYVYVANHTSMIDVIILLQRHGFSLLGQRHKGIVRFLQETVIGCLQCIWFERGAIKDRQVVASRLLSHVKDPARNPILMFPEGTCVNNEYCIQFKKGVFGLGVPVLPVALKYNKMFVDPFWNSRKQSFPMHLVELMTSWCLICDVYFLEPMYQEDGEPALAFANRVKKRIAEKAGLKNVDWDGYMKHWKPSKRFTDGIQSRFAASLKATFVASGHEAVPVGGGSEDNGLESNDDSDVPPSMSPFRKEQFARET